VDGEEWTSIIKEVRLSKDCGAEKYVSFNSYCFTVGKGTSYWGLDMY